MKIKINWTRALWLLTAFVICLGILMAVSPKAKADTFYVCPDGRSGIIAGTPTTCAFAENVRYAWIHQQGNIIQAYSPVTGGVYVMSCNPSTETLNTGMAVSGYTCIGGNSAEVVIW